MSKNDFFRFKQFEVKQGQTAMKVTTDACVLGAVSTSTNAKHILDIGTGTGMLALMAAQNHPDALIDAVEIEKNAFEQATSNFNESVFSDRIKCVNCSIQMFTSTLSYDLIVCNPPFFIDSYKSANSAKNNSRHTDLLSFSDLVASVVRLLSTNGIFYLILPVTEHRQFEITADSVLHLHSRNFLHENNETAPHRIVSAWSKSGTGNVTESKLIYKEKSGVYTPDFIALLRPFYLYL